MFKKENFRKFLLVIIGFSSLILLLIPWIIVEDILSLSEEAWESIAILFFLTLIYSAYHLYYKELKRLKSNVGNLEDRLQETFKYIGSVNLQIDEIKKSFTNFKKYPENKKEMQEVFNYFAEKIINIINADWVILKIIDIESGKTIRQNEFKRNKGAKITKVENHDILAGRCYLQACSIVRSGQENLKIKAACILPAKLKNREQELFIQSIINQIEMMFLVYSSLNFKK
jgi:hypothetical protein